MGKEAAMIRGNEKFKAQMKICLKEKKARSKGQRVNRSTCEKYCTKVVKKQQKKRRVNNKRENVFLYD